MSTGVEIAIRLHDVTARADSLPTCTDRQPFVNLSDLKDEVKQTVGCATLEQDFFRLDGSMEPFPDHPAGLRWGLWSQSMSGADCGFATPPVLKIGFTQGHSSIGITLYFLEAEQDYCSALRVRWMDGSGNMMAAKDFFPTEAAVFLKNKVEGYRSLEITFLATAKPYRYLKLGAVDYGMDLLLDGSMITQADILEEVDPATATVSVNTLDFTLYSASAEFSPLNPNGIFSVLQQKQKLEVQALISGQRRGMGSFFLEHWEADERGRIKLRGVDAVGLMDRVRYDGGLYEGQTAGAALQELFAASQTLYQLDAGLAGKKLNGYLGIGTARQALGQIALAVGAVVDCSRGEAVRLYPLPERPSSFIGYDRRFSGQRVRLKPAVTGIDVTAHRFTQSEESFTAFEDTLAAGSYRVQLTEPVHSPTAVGARITGSGVNYIRLTVDAPGRVTVTGKRYLHTKQMFSGQMAEQGANLSANRLEVANATLVSRENAGEVLARLRDYYGGNLISEFSLPLGAERVGDRVMVKSMQGENIKGVVESMEIDLTGGCLVRMKICARRIETVSSSYTGELYTGQMWGVL